MTETITQGTLASQTIAVEHIRISSRRSFEEVRPNKEIARLLSCAEATVKVRMHNIFLKLGEPVLEV